MPRTQNSNISTRTRADESNGQQEIDATVELLNRTNRLMQQCFRTGCDIEDEEVIFDQQVKDLKAFTHSVRGRTTLGPDESDALSRTRRALEELGQELLNRASEATGGGQERGLGGSYRGDGNHQALATRPRASEGGDDTDGNALDIVDIKPKTSRHRRRQQAYRGRDRAARREELETDQYSRGNNDNDSEIC